MNELLEGICDECGGEFDLEEHEEDCPHCGELHSIDGSGSPDSGREDFCRGT